MEKGSECKAGFTSVAGGIPIWLIILLVALVCTLLAVGLFVGLRKKSKPIDVSIYNSIAYPYRYIQDNESKTGLIVTNQFSPDDVGGHGGQGTYDPHMHLPYDPINDRRQQKQRPDGKHWHSYTSTSTYILY